MGSPAWGRGWSIESVTVAPPAAEKAIADARPRGGLRRRQALRRPPGRRARGVPPAQATADRAGGSLVGASRRIQAAGHGRRPAARVGGAEQRWAKPDCERCHHGRRRQRGRPRRYPPWHHLEAPGCGGGHRGAGECEVERAHRRLEGQGGDGALGCPQALDAGGADRAGEEVLGHPGRLLARQRVVDVGREELVLDVPVGHALLSRMFGSRRSSSACRLMRARARRERTVPTGTSRPSAISS